MVYNVQQTFFEEKSKLDTLARLSSLGISHTLISVLPLLLLQPLIYQPIPEDLVAHYFQSVLTQAIGRSKKTQRLGSCGRYSLALGIGGVLLSNLFVGEKDLVVFEPRKEARVDVPLGSVWWWLRL